MSEDLFHWERIGLATFEPFQGIDFVHVDNKDASIFPVAIPNHAGKMQLALLHRPLFPGTRPEETACQGESRTWIASMKASGFPIVRCRLRAWRRIVPACSTRIIGWQLRCRLGKAENRRRHSAHSDQARLADSLPRREQNGGTGQ
jgi:hypothetical protein